MKMLDKVILAYELCSEGKCEECPYRQIATNLGYVPCDPTERESDVLHYLKEYREISKAMNPKVRKNENAG